MNKTVSAIVPTVGRQQSLSLLRNALAAQTHRPDEVVVCDGAGDERVRVLIESGPWAARGLTVRYLRVHPPNAVRQRTTAIAAATGSLLLLLDDDVIPEPTCVAALVECLRSSGAVAVSADFSNQQWPAPTTLWRWYLRLVHHISGVEWQGRVIGRLLRFGYVASPTQPVP